MSGIFLVAAKRTPFGAFGGALTNVSSTQLGVVAARAALATPGGGSLSNDSQDNNSIDPTLVDECYFGNVLATGRDAAYLARHVALKSGCRIETPCLTVNRLCGSGFETIVQAAKSIQLQQSHLILAGGAESMSQAPLVVDGQRVRFQAGISLGKGLHLRDALWDGLTDANANDGNGMPMGMTAERLAERYGITREECDEYAVQSQQRWKEAHDAGVFRREMASVEVETAKGKKTNSVNIVDTDEHPRPQTTLESVAKLRPVFVPEKGVVTAANASGICDGAGCIVVASEQAVTQHNLQPLARLASYAVTGCDPEVMGIGPVESIRAVLTQVDWDLHRDVDRVEINEAFAAQTLACAKELDLNMSKLNVHGGAIALGHPLGASGSRIVAHLCHQFAATDENHKRFVGAACIGGGQGIAVALERV